MTRAIIVCHAVGLVFLATIAVSCGGEPIADMPKSQDSPLTTNNGLSDAQSQVSFKPVLVSTDLSVGINRFIVGLVDNIEASLVIDAQLSFRFYRLEDEDTVAAVDEDHATILVVDKSYTHVHQDGKSETHGTGPVGVYVAHKKFDTSGPWGVAISGLVNELELPTLTLEFMVNDRSRSIPLGDNAARTLQTVLTDVEDIFDIDTSSPPDPHMHNTTIAEAVTSTIPSVILFGSPGLCLSQTCGPVKEAVDAMYEQFGHLVHFIHVEPYDLIKARDIGKLVLVPAMSEWGLLTDPWVFVVDSDGRITAKFEGIVTYRELETALLAVLPQTNNPV
jgi:hypothetical protein